MAAAKNHSAKLGIDPATIDWWDDVKSNQVYKEAGEFNKKFLQFIYSFQHKMVNTLEVYFNPAVCGSIDANDSFGLDDNRDGIFNDNNKYKVSTYFMYPFDRDEHVYYQDEIENIGIFNFNYYILKGLKDYQKGPGSYQLTVCDQYIDDYDSSIKDFVDFYTDKSTKSNEEDFSQWKEDKCAQIMNLLNALESDSSFINTIKIKAWRKELMKSGYGILDNEGKRNQLRAELEYAIKKGGGLREFRAEFQLGRSAWGIDPYSDLSDDEKTNFGITPKSLAYQRQPRSGDEQNWDMTYGFARFGGQGYHTQHVANLFTNMSTGSIKGITKNDLMLKGVFKEGDGTGKVNKNGLIWQNDLVNAIYNNKAFFGGSYKSLYNTVGLFRMKADIISYDRMLNIMCSSIYNFNRSNKADYKKRLEDWKDRKDMFERDEMLAEKIRQKSLQESSKTMQLIKIAGKKQDQEYKKRGQAIAKAKYKKEDKKHEFVNLISNMQSAKKKEKSKEIAKEKAHKTDSQKQNPQSKAAIKQFVMKNMKKKAKA